MKPHTHKDLIIAWANGAEIQEYVRPISCNCVFGWTDCPNPSWEAYNAYRIKPREFKEGAWYPALSKTGDREILVYKAGNLCISPVSGGHDLELFSWIGEELKIEWPEE